MAGSQLDGAGMAKMKTLEEALLRLQGIHSLVERMGVTSAAGLAPGPIIIATATAAAAVAALAIVVARSAGRQNHAAELRGE